MSAAEAARDDLLRRDVKKMQESKAMFEGMEEMMAQTQEDVSAEAIMVATDDVNELPAMSAEGPMDPDPTDEDNVQDDESGQEIETIPPSEAYLAQCYSMGILTQGQFNDVASFDVLKEKVRQLAIRAGFRVRIQRPSSGHRRVWICKSKNNCPFSITGNKNRRGVSIVAKLAHNHPLHTNAATANGATLSFCEATTQEMATFVRNSELYASSPDISKITAQQISNVVHAKTGYHINAMRASRIKHMLLNDPEGFLLPDASTPTAAAPDAASPAGMPWKTLAEAVWDGFMLVVNDPHTTAALGLAGVRELVALFKKPQHKDILRGIVLMSCPNPEAPPSVVSNRPSPAKFLDVYRRQVEYGFFEGE